MSLLPVDEALRRLLDGATALDTETVPLADAAGRALSADVTARRTQPPFDASAMDGYAVRAVDAAGVPVRLKLVGEAPAGRRFAGAVGTGEAVRIFTGAPLPEGADAIVIQENARRLDAVTVEIVEPAEKGRHIRRRGLDFAEGDVLLRAGRLLDAAALSLAASGNHPNLPVFRRPRLAIIATGDELVAPGAAPGDDQIVSSNAPGVAAVARQWGADVSDLGIVADRPEAVADALTEARRLGADVVVTLGGASVGDHDLVRDVLMANGVTMGFWKIAMRPGKPLMFGTAGNTRFLGLPGNPVASLVCSHLFVAPLVARLAGRPHRYDLRPARLGRAVAANDLRQDYVRAVVAETPDGLVATPFDIQDSSMLRVLADANGLLVRPPFDTAAPKGAPCTVLMLREAA